MLGRIKTTILGFFGVTVCVDSVLLGSSGAIAANGAAKGALAGFTVVKTAAKTGRYTITFHRRYTRLLYGGCTVVGLDDAAYTATKGSFAVLRDDDVATDGTIEVQLLNVSGADAEAVDATTLKFFFVLEN